jgi:ankyrin repeat protein
MYCNIDGRTPLHTFFNAVIGTIFQCHSDSIDEEVRDSQGMTVFHFAAWSSKSGSQICRNYVERCNGGLTGNILSKDHSGRSVLHYAAERGNLAMIKYILGLPGKLDIDCKDLDGRTALSYAAETKRCEVIEMLKGRGGNLRCADSRGRTPLHHAARRGNLAAVEKLIKLGGAEDVWLEDNDGATPLQHASQRGATSLVKCLEELQRAGLENNPALYNSQSRHLLRNGAKERDAPPHLRSPCKSKGQGTGGILRSCCINSTFLEWGCSSLAGKFMVIVFAVLLWEWLKLSIRVIPL